MNSLTDKEIQKVLKGWISFLRSRGIQEEFAREAAIKVFENACLFKNLPPERVRLAFLFFAAKRCEQPKNEVSTSQPEIENELTELENEDLDELLLLQKLNSLPQKEAEFCKVILAKVLLGEPLTTNQRIRLPILRRALRECLLTRIE